MTDKRYVQFEFTYDDFGVKDNKTNEELWNPVVVDRLNEQDERIKELDKEKQILKDKAKVILDYYSRRYATAVFNNARHSKQFRSDLWIVMEVLYNLGLCDDGDV